MHAQTATSVAPLLRQALRQYVPRIDRDIQQLRIRFTTEPELGAAMLAYERAIGAGLDAVLQRAVRRSARLIVGKWRALPPLSVIRGGRTDG